MSLQVVVLMLDDTSLKTRKGLFVFLEVLIQKTQDDRLGAHHVLADTGQRETALAIGAGLLALFDQFRIDKHPFEVLALGIVLAQLATVHDEQSPGFAYLRCRQAAALCGREGFKHISNQLLEFRRRFYLLRLFA